MLITFDYNKLEQGLRALTSVVNDKAVKEDMKNIIFRYTTDGSVMLIAYNTRVFCGTQMKEAAQIDWEKDEPKDGYFQLKASLIKTLATYRGQKTIKATKVVIHVAPNYSQVDVLTEAADEKSQYAALYKQREKYRIESPKVISKIIYDIEHNMADFEGTPVKASALNRYISMLLPTLKVDGTDNVSCRIMFAHGYVYTAPYIYFALMPNKLPDVLNNMQLTTTASVFLGNFLSNIGDEDVTVATELAEGAGSALNTQMLVKFKHGDTLAVVRAYTATNALKCEAYTTHGNTYVMLNRAYLLETLRKAEVIQRSECTFDFVIREGEAEGTITTDSWRQPLAIEGAKLDVHEFMGHSYYSEGSNGAELKVSVAFKVEQLRKMVFAHAHDITETQVILYFEPATNATFKIAVTDATEQWQTKLNSVSQAKANTLPWA